MLIFCMALAVLVLLTLFLILKKWRVTLLYRDNAFTVKVGCFTVTPKGDGKKQDSDYIKIPKLGFKDFGARVKIVRALYIVEKPEIIKLLQEAQRLVQVRSFSMSLTYGFGDAAVTGIANGIVWNVINCFVNFAGRYIDLDGKTNIAVSPQYTRSCFDADVCFVFDVRLFQIIGFTGRAKKLFKRLKLKYHEAVKVNGK